MYLIFALIFSGLPLLGILLVENGAYGPSIGQEGFPNGAGWAYSFYLALLISVALLVAAGRRQTGIAMPLPYADGEFRQVARWTIFLNIGFILILFFGFDAIKVLRGEVSKQEFRVSLGAFGAVAFMITKFIAPLLLAYLAALWPVTSRSAHLCRLLLANFALVFIAGFSWGFKTTSITMMMPALILLFWRPKVGQLLLLGVIAVATVVGLFFWFDQEIEGYVPATEFLIRRLTTMQGDVPWLVWGLYTDGQSLPAYGRTLVVAVGDKIFSLVSGIPKAEYQTWVEYHYDLLITVVAGAPLDQVEGGHSVTGTPFSEGIIAGGIVGAGIFAVIAGALVGGLYKLIASSLNGRAPVAGALGATYASVVIFPWLNGGAIVQLFHISLIVGLLTALGILFLIRRAHLHVPKARSVATNGNSVGRIRDPS